MNLYPKSASNYFMFNLETFGMHHLERVSDDTLREELGRFWEEIHLSYQDNAVNLVEEPCNFSISPAFIVEAAPVKLYFLAVA